jgi:competence protein ComFB
MSIDSAVKVENANYYKVFYFIDKILSENPGYCKCHRCRMDAAALALNTLPPHYFINPSHSKAQDLGSPWVLIEMAVLESMDRVNKYPHHTPKTLEGTEKPVNLGIPITDTGLES